ncbi:VOC family protein [Pseudonocardia dioxanivorans]|uniref:VOC family protein n=1 Tax=Pseudonocardia dioxanivorans TaxID=240495 RepID=UPI000CD215F0|nr:VOC family protein [Pseudonocardia dioxanivorans]
MQAGALLVTFLRRGGADVELLEDILTSDGRPGEGPGSTTGDSRAISRFVARTGGGLHHVAVRVDDIEAGLDGLRKVGVGLLDDHRRPGSRRSRIAFADRRTTGGLVLHLVQR